MSFHPLGALLAFPSAITYTFYILVADTAVHRLAPVVLSALVMTGTAASLGVHAVFTGGVDLDFEASGWFWLGHIAMKSTVVAMLAAKTLTSVQLGGGALVLSSVALLQLRRTRARPPAQLVAEPDRSASRRPASARAGRNGSTEPTAVVP
ncbi:hypothetical protein AB0M36_25180 [Actinoplanes sp. NPDC051346]|uniref:hypothetical protein n=1 Tax=Actinoplanes sp. NPDC051346 TaxID=3155048 RepID=UPI00341A7BAF